MLHRKPLIIDCFTFYMELDVLEKRLNFLDKYVDKFVIVESPTTHSGSEKTFYFDENKDRFKKWAHKIIHVKTKPLGDGFWNREENRHRITDYTENIKQTEDTWKVWEREGQQRHSILDGLTACKDDDIVLISDVDEIPDPKYIKKYDNTKTFNMWLFRFNFDYMPYTECTWKGTVLTTVKDARKEGPNYYRNNRWGFEGIENAGWHITKFGGDEVAKKIFKTYAHANNYNYDEHVDKKTDHSTGEPLKKTPPNIYIPDNLL